MKKAIVIILSFVFPLIMIGQTSSIEKLFNKYENVSGFELEMNDSDIDINAEGNSDFMKFLDNIENVYVLNFDKKDGKQNSLDGFKRKLDKLIDKHNFISVMDLSGDGEFKILITKDKNDKAIELLMITDDEDDSSFIYVTN